MKDNDFKELLQELFLEQQEQYYIGNPTIILKTITVESEN